MKLLGCAPILLFVFVALGAGLWLASSLAEADSLPDGPVAVIWDHELCAHCGMHVGEPGFAAQLQTEDGEIFNFDDPGCAFEFLAKRQPKVHALYFHEGAGEQGPGQWLTAAQTMFKTVLQSPMGYGIRAVKAPAKGAMSLTRARDRVLEQSHRARKQG